MRCNRIFIGWLGIMLFNISVQAQSSQATDALENITLEECYAWARANYPLIKQLDLLEKSTQYNLDNASKGNLPQITINGQATYQSEVTNLPIEIPNVEIPEISKDQYKIYGEIYQPLTNFKNVDIRKEQIALNGSIEQQKTEVDLYQLKDRINQLYFGVLLMDAKNEQFTLLNTDIDSTISRLNAAIDNGTATLMDKKLLEVEKIGIDQQIAENESNKASFLVMISALTGKNINLSTTFSPPETYTLTSAFQRPELALFDLQKKLLGVQSAQIDNKRIPNVGLFVQGGLGRPALNFLSNDFAPYYIAGLKFNWNISNFYTSKNERQQLGVQQQLIASQKEIFLLNNNLSQSQQSTEISKYEALLASDQDIVSLREEIKTTAEVQLVNGLISTIDYIKIINDVSRAKEQLNLHEIMLLQAQYNLKTTVGN